LLTIEPGRSYHHGGDGSITEEHDSRRQHLRRGHFRTFEADRYKAAKGKRIWVQSHLVGDPDKGIIVKDYKVEKLDGLLRG